MKQNPKRKSLDRFLSRCGVASRTEAARLVKEKRVRVNGKPAVDPHLWVHIDRDRVEVDGRRVGQPVERRVVVYNKPRGLVVSARDEKGRATVVDALPEPYRSDSSLKPVGRLDKASGGLLLFTNDNDLANKVLDRDSKLPKFYRVKLTPPPDSSALHRLHIGVRIDDSRRRTAPARVSVERKSAKSAVIKIALTEGRNRQIRRMAQAVGCEVEWLVRVAIGPVQLEDLPIGEAREITRDELEALLACL